LNGLGRHVVTKNEGLVTIWEGFVNRISARIGGRSIVIGPLLDIANKVNVIYSTIDTSTTPPTTGIRVITATSEDTDSQEQFGVIEQTLSLSGTLQTLAERARDKYLSENKFPPRSTDITLSSKGEVGMSVECLGYYHLLNITPFNDLNSGTQTLSARLQALLATNSIISTDYSRIETNSLAIPRYVDDNPRVKGLIEDLLTLGDSNDNRYRFGIFAERKAIYEAIVAEITYYYRIDENEIEDKANNKVYPWNVLPGYWLRTPDFLVGRSQPTNIMEDIRNTFIVNVNFTAPYDLTIQGDELETLPQLLAKVQRGINLPG